MIASTTRKLRFVGQTKSLISLRQPFPGKPSLKSNFVPESRSIHRSFARYLATNAIRLDLEFTTTHTLQHEASKAYPDNPMFGTYIKDGEGPGVYEWITFQNFDREVQKFRNVLTHHNIDMDDKIALISNNRTEWAVIVYAGNGLGAQLVPMYEAQLEKDWKYILNDSDAKMVVCATEEIYQKVITYPGNVGRVEHVLCLDAPADKPYSYQYWMEKVADEKPVHAHMHIPEDHISTIIYTSGTTGNPKGVELSHRNLVSNLKGSNLLWQEGHMLEQQTTLAFLPWAHIFGQTCELHQMTATGSARAIVPNRELILECLGVVKPTFVISVPMLFNRVYDGVMKTINEGSPVKKALVTHALAVARKRNHCLEFGLPVPALTKFQFDLFDKIVFKKIRDKLGGNLKHMGAGGAATSLPVLQFFEDIGIPIMEGYGLTETSPVISLGTRSWDHRRLGCVGVALPGCTIRIVDPETLQELPPDTDGEVTTAGPSVMTGYRNNKAANDEVFYYHEGEKYFRTGDLGQMVEGKFLKITGRIKEQFKLENGKFVVPAPLEDIFCRSPYIQQVFICGANHPHPVALVVPSLLDLGPWYDSQETKLAAPLPTAEQAVDPSIHHAPLFDDPAFLELMDSEMKRVSTACKSYEKPLQWLPVLNPFTQENQMLTPKMSLRRQNIVKTFKAEIEQLLQGKGRDIKY